jgi:acetyl-CoA carboxylase carboxyl transferase subunit beta
MLDRVTHRKDMREELITITRMLMGKTPAIKGELPAPDVDDLTDDASSVADQSVDAAEAEAPK